MDPVWRADGREIIFLGGGRVMAAAVRLLAGRIDVGNVVPLFSFRKVGPRKAHDVTPDGQRIIALTDDTDTAAAPLTLLVNWPALLRK